MGLMTKDQLLTREELRVKRVDLPNGNFVYVRMMTAFSHNSFMASIRPFKESNKIDYTDFNAKLAARTICDENGQLYFDLNEVRDLSKSLSVATMAIICDAAVELNNLEDIAKGESDEDNVKESVKNSETDQPTD